MAVSQGKHVLVVDDYPDVLDIWALFLRSSGYRVSTAADGLEALEKAEQLLPDLIVLDLELPRMSGFDVARRLRSNPETHSIPLIAATGYSTTRLINEARHSGFDQVVIKPCDPDRLVEEIERLMPADREQGAEPVHVRVEPRQGNG